jgi:antitoxin PrlF
MKYGMSTLRAKWATLAADSQRQGPSSQVRDVAQNTSMWHSCYMDTTLVLGQQGRLVIPANMRAALGLAPGDRLHLHLAGHRLVLERQQDAVAELRELASGVPRSRSLVEELLADRRVAASAE